MKPHQLDHIMISTKWWKSIKNCRAYNSIDIGSDHKIVSACFKVSFRATKRPPNNRCQFHNEKLLDPATSKKFDLDLQNRFNILLCEATRTSNNTNQDEIQTRANVLEKALFDSSSTILGKRTRKKQPH
jgi:hypothetical protein